MHYLGESGAVLRRQLCRLDDNRASGDEGCACLARYEEEGEVPRQYACHHADRLLREEDCLAAVVALDYLALDMAGEGCHIVEIGYRRAYLYLCPRACLALLAHYYLHKFCLAPAYAFCHLLQIFATLNGRHFRPFALCGFRCVEGFLNIFYSAFRLTRTHFFCRRIEDINPLSRTAFCEFAVDVHFQVFHLSLRFF